MTAPRPIFIAALGIAVAALWGGWIVPGTVLVGIAACMEV